MSVNKGRKPMKKISKAVTMAGLLTQNERQWLIGLKKELQK